MRDRGDGGQSTVELALVLPLVAMVLLAVAQAGVLVRDRVLVVNAAREAARAAAVDPEEGVAVHAARRSGSLDPARLSVRLGGATSPGEHVEVTVTYRAPTSVAIIGAVVPDVTFTSTVVMRVE